MKSFRDRFAFNPNLHLYIGTERECFLTRDGFIVPIAAEIISKVNGTGNYGYELSACQLEMRTNPTTVDNIGSALHESQKLLTEHETSLGFQALHTEVAPYSMPLDVYPDPTGRYQVITKEMPMDVLRAACRVAGTHVHIGMASPEHAITAYNAVLPEIPKLCAMGDKSNNERLEIYKVMAPDFEPPRYENWEDYERYALSHGFSNSPRNCWHLVRISVHGTIEFRMFGATPNIEEVTEWAKYCHSICQKAF